MKGCFECKVVKKATAEKIKLTKKNKILSLFTLLLSLILIISLILNAFLIIEVKGQNKIKDRNTMGGEICISGKWKEEKL